MLSEKFGCLTYSANYAETGWTSRLFIASNGSAYLQQQKKKQLNFLESAWYALFTLTLLSRKIWSCHRLITCQEAFTSPSCRMIDYIKTVDIAFPFLKICSTYLIFISSFLCYVSILTADVKICQPTLKRRCSLRPSLSRSQLRTQERAWQIIVTDVIYSLSNALRMIIFDFFVIPLPKYVFFG